MDAFDHLRIDTPEQVALELPVAGVGSRFLAIAVDTLIQILAAILAVAVLAFALPRILRLVPGVINFGPVLGPALLVLFMFCLYWGYFAIFEILWRGRTPGKRVARIRVIKDTGAPLDATSALLRNLLRAIDLLPALYGAGIVCMILNRQSQRIGDLVAGTVVVHDRIDESVAAAWSPAPAAAPATTFATGVLLSAAEIVLIETFLERRYSLERSVRNASAARIGDLIQQRTQIAPVPGQSVEEYLEAMARQARDAGRMRQA